MSRLSTIVFEKNWQAIHEKALDGGRRYRYIVNRGSSRSSKTISLIDCFDLIGRSEYNRRLTVWRDTKTDCRKTVLNDALKRFKAIGNYKVKQDFNKTESIFTYTDTDSTFEIHGTDDEETVHGVSQDYTWMNEPYKISRDVFDQIDQRTGECVFIDYNPKKNHWVEDLMKDPRTIVIDSTFLDNPFCPSEMRAKILSYQPVKCCDIVISKALTEQEARLYNTSDNLHFFTKKNIKELSRCLENEYKNSASEYKWLVYGKGEKAEKPNRIFNWREISDNEYHILYSPVYYGVDWGSVDPWGILEAKYNDGTLYLHERSYASENVIRQSLTPSDLAVINAVPESEDERREATGLVVWRFTTLDIPKDRPIICDTNRPMKGAALRRAGWEVYPALKGPGSILDGIDLLNDLREICFTSSSINLKYEQENYSRKVDSHGIVLDEPEDAFNHLCDPTRYIAQYLKSIGVINNI